MCTANFPPSADFFCLAKRQYFSFGLLRVEQKGGHTMEMATDEPTPTASHQELSGSNTGHFTVTYDSEDTNYCAQGLAGEKVQVYVGLEVSLRGLPCRWLTTISSGHCASERVWMTSRERGRQTRGHQHEFCAKMKFPAQKKIPV